jgi:hypothetical protein
MKEGLRPGAELRRFKETKDREKPARFAMDILFHLELCRIQKERPELPPQKVVKKIDQYITDKTAIYDVRLNTALRHFTFYVVREAVRNILQAENIDRYETLSQYSDYEAYIFQAGDYPLINFDRDFMFPIGPIPVIGPDPYMDGLREKNPNIYRLLHPLVNDNLPLMWDSREDIILNRKYHRYIKFPVVLKQEGAFSGEGITVVNSQEDFDEELNKRYNNNETFIIQEALKGDSEYTIHFLGYHGKLQGVECFQSMFSSGELYIKGKDIPSNTARTFIGCYEEAEAVSIVDKIVRGTMYNGFGCVQYKKDSSTGRLGIIELNPRTCGGMFPTRRSVREGYAAKVQRLLNQWVKAHRQF